MVATQLSSSTSLIYRFHLPHCLLMAQIQEDVGRARHEWWQDYRNHQLAPKPDPVVMDNLSRRSDAPHKLGSSHEGKASGSRMNENLGCLVAKTTGSLIAEAMYGKLKIRFPNLAWMVSSFAIFLHSTTTWLQRSYQTGQEWEKEWEKGQSEEWS